jgi:hypothetical protein
LSQLFLVESGLDTSFGVDYGVPNMAGVGSHLLFSAVDEGNGRISDGVLIQAQARQTPNPSPTPTPAVSPSETQSQPFPETWTPRESNQVRHSNSIFPSPRFISSMRFSLWQSQIIPMTAWEAQSDVLFSIRFLKSHVLSESPAKLSGSGHDSDLFVHSSDSIFTSSELGRSILVSFSRGHAPDSGDFDFLGSGCILPSRMFSSSVEFSVSFTLPSGHEFGQSQIIHHTVCVFYSDAPFSFRLPKSPILLKSQALAPDNVHGSDLFVLSVGPFGQPFSRNDSFAHRSDSLFPSSGINPSMKCSPSVNSESQRPTFRSQPLRFSCILPSSDVDGSGRMPFSVNSQSQCPLTRPQVMVPTIRRLRSDFVVSTTFQTSEPFCESQTPGSNEILDADSILSLSRFTSSTKSSFSVALAQSHIIDSLFPTKSASVGLSPTTISDVFFETYLTLPDRLAVRFTESTAFSPMVPRVSDFMEPSPFLADTSPPGLVERPGSFTAIEMCGIGVGLLVVLALFVIVAIRLCRSRGGAVAPVSRSLDYSEHDSEDSSDARVLAFRQDVGKAVGKSTWDESDGDENESDSPSI